LSVTPVVRRSERCNIEFISQPTMLNLLQAAAQQRQLPPNNVRLTVVHCPDSVHKALSERVAYGSINSSADAQTQVAM